MSDGVRLALREEVNLLIPEIQRRVANGTELDLDSNQLDGMRGIIRDEMTRLLPKMSDHVVSTLSPRMGNFMQDGTPTSQSQGSGDFFEVTLERDLGNKWGMDVDYATARGLKVVSIKDDGIIKDYNDNHPARTVVAEDWIVAVNDMQNDSVRMAMRLADSQLNSITLVVRKASSVTLDRG